MLYECCTTNPKTASPPELDLVITHNSPQRHRDAEKIVFRLCASAFSAVAFGLMGNHQDSWRPRSRAPCDGNQFVVIDVKF